jgi:plastocyanin
MDAQAISNATAKNGLAGLAISGGLRPTKVAMASIAMLLAAGAQAEEIAAPVPLTETKPAEVRIVSTEFGYAPAKVMVIAGRAVTLILDNSGAETEHDLFVPAVGFRLHAKAGGTARKSTVFEKPGQYEYSCDLPGHRDAGMKGTLIVRVF